MVFLILIILTIFLLVKLNSILGTENEEKYFSSQENEVHNLKDIIVAEEKQDIFEDFEYLTIFQKQVFQKIHQKNKNITPKSFINVAKNVILEIFEAYSENNYETLKSLLSKEMFEALTSEESHKEERIEVLKCSNLTIEDAIEESKQYSIKIKLDMLQNIYDNSGKSSEQTTEIWTFTNDLSSPIWKITSIEKF